MDSTLLKVEPAPEVTDGDALLTLLPRSRNAWVPRHRRSEGGLTKPSLSEGLACGLRRSSEPCPGFPPRGGGQLCAIVLQGGLEDDEGALRERTESVSSDISTSGGSEAGSVLSFAASDVSGSNSSTASFGSSIGSDTASSLGSSRRSVRFHWRREFHVVDAFDYTDVAEDWATMGELRKTFDQRFVRGELDVQRLSQLRCLFHSWRNHGSNAALRGVFAGWCAVRKCGRDACVGVDLGVETSPEVTAVDSLAGVVFSLAP